MVWTMKQAPPPWTIYVIACLSGANVLAIEILGTRILGPFYGVTLFLWSALITVTLLSLSVGYALGGRLADREASVRVLSLAWSPVTDVREDENGLNVSVELPGLSTDDVSVSVENGILSISGEKKQVTEEEDSEGIRHLAERRYGNFERTFRLPRGVDSEKVKAKFNNGLLNIDIPKSEAAKKKQVEIK